MIHNLEPEAPSFYNIWYADEQFYSQKRQSEPTERIVLKKKIIITFVLSYLYNLGNVYSSLYLKRCRLLQRMPAKCFNKSCESYKSETFYQPYFAQIDSAIQM